MCVVISYALSFCFTFALFIFGGDVLVCMRSLFFCESVENARGYTSHKNLFKIWTARMDQGYQMEGYIVGGNLQLVTRESSSWVNYSTWVSAPTCAVRTRL